MKDPATRFAVVSVPNVLGDLDGNIARHEMWIRRAAELGAQVVGFPECSLTGYGDEQQSAITIDSHALRRLAQCASAAGVYALVGFAERQGSACFSSCVLLGPQGVTGLARKINCIPEETSLSTGGAHFPVFEIGSRKIAVAICADASTYEVPKILAMRGAEILFCPHANAHRAFGGDPERWRQWRLARWQTFAPDWGVYLLGCNLRESGSTPPLEGQRQFCGGVVAMDPYGAPIVSRDSESAGEPMLMLELPRVENPAAQLFASFRPDVIYSSGQWEFGAARAAPGPEKDADHPGSSDCSLAVTAEGLSGHDSSAFYCAAAKAYHDLSSIGRYPLPPASLQYAVPLQDPADLAATIPLPKTAAEALSQISLYEALERRRSRRQFASIPLRVEQVGNLLWATQGLQRASSPETEYRTAPSAGGLFAVTAFVLAENIDRLATGVYVYRPREHTLQKAKGPVVPFATWFHTDDIDYRSAPAAVIFVAHLDRIAARYGERGYRYGLIEAGHAAQNLMLAATALEVSCVPAGGYHDRRVSSDLKLGPLDVPVHCLILGCA